MKPVRMFTLVLLVVAIVLAMVVVAEARAEGAEQGYLGGAPNDGWLALWTLDGVYGVQLGDGCDGAVAGVNVLVDGDQLQVIDPLQGLQDQVCTLTTRVKKGDVPCSTNPDGICDVAWSR